LSQLLSKVTVKSCSFT